MVFCGSRRFFTWTPKVSVSEEQGGLHMFRLSEFNQTVKSLQLEIETNPMIYFGK